MPDYYHLPALILTALLLPGFGHLYLRSRDTRTLLWFLGFFLALVRMILHYHLGHWSFHEEAHPWVAAASQTSIQISSALFLASLSPLRFRLGRFNVLYVIPFTIPLIIYSILFYGVFHGILPNGPIFLVFPALVAVSLLTGFFWSAAKGRMPAWLGIAACVVLGSLGVWILFAVGGGWPLTFIECANHLVTALLLVFVFRRISPGLIPSVLGFAAWSLSILEIFPSIANDPVIDLYLARFIVMGKVVAAIGMILLALEDELAINKAAKERERRARVELEAYTNLILSRRRVEDFDRQGDEICKTVAAHSRFAQSALLLHTASR